MKIKIKDVKPGMVIIGDRHFGFVLLCKTNNKYDKFFERKPFILMYDAHDPYSGPGYSPINDINEKVKVIVGKKRERIIKELRQGLRKHESDIHDSLQLIDIILTKI